MVEIRSAIMGYNSTAVEQIRENKPDQVQEHLVNLISYLKAVSRFRVRWSDLGLWLRFWPALTLLQ